MKNDNFTPLIVTFVKLYKSNVVTQNILQKSLMDQGNYKALKYLEFRALYEESLIRLSLWK